MSNYTASQDVLLILRHLTRNHPDDLPLEELMRTCLPRGIQWPWEEKSAPLKPDEHLELQAFESWWFSKGQRSASVNEYQFAWSAWRERARMAHTPADDAAEVV